MDYWPIPIWVNPMENASFGGCLTYPTVIERSELKNHHVVAPQISVIVYRLFLWAMFHSYVSHKRVGSKLINAFLFGSPLGDVPMTFTIQPWPSLETRGHQPVVEKGSVQQNRYPRKIMLVNVASYFWWKISAFLPKNILVSGFKHVDDMCGFHSTNGMMISLDDFFGGWVESTNQLSIGDSDDFAPYTLVRFPFFADEIWFGIGVYEWPNHSCFIFLIFCLILSYGFVQEWGIHPSVWPSLRNSFSPP